MVENLDKKLSPHLALAETSAFVAHDLCAQLHVMKFCLEELSGDKKVNKKLYEEYVSQLNSSTEYMDNLLINYRRLLKLERDSNGKFIISSVLNYSQYVTKSHYQGMSHHLYFDQEATNDNFEFVGNHLMFAHIIFSIYSGFIECEHHRSQRDQYQFSHKLNLDKEKGDSLYITLLESQMNLEDFLNVIKARTKVKGRLRQWCGLDLLSDELQLSDDFFQVTETNEGTTVRIMLPFRVEC